MMASSLHIRAVIVIVALIIVDQITKYGFFALIDAHGGAISVLPFFNLVQVYNPGVSFGLGSNMAYSHLFFSLLALSITAVLFYMMWKETQRWHVMAYAMVIAGALGNVIDRALVGAVMDFLDFHAFGYHWPAFNVADSAIFMGVVLLIFMPGRPDSNESTSKKEKPQEGEGEIK